MHYIKPLQDYVELVGSGLLWFRLANVPQATTDAWLREVNITTMMSLEDLQRTYRGVESPVLQYGDTIAYFDGKNTVMAIALMNFALRAFALGLIILCGIIFRYAQNAVTVPIERMVSHLLDLDLLL